MSSNSTAAAAAAKQAEEIWRWEYRLYCESVVKRAVQSHSERVAQLPTEILGLIVELACDRSISTKLAVQALKSGYCIPDESSVRRDTLSLMAASWTLHDLARPFLYELVKTSSNRCYESFFSLGDGHKRRPGQEEWRKADYSHVRHLSLWSPDKPRQLKVQLPFSTENPFPHIDVFFLSLTPQPEDESIAAALLKDFLQAVRYTTPVHVGCYGSYYATIDVVILALDVFADSARLASILDATHSNKSETERRAAIKEKDIRSLIHFIPKYDKRPSCTPPIERAWPTHAPSGYASSSRD